MSYPPGDAQPPAWTPPAPAPPSWESPGGAPAGAAPGAPHPAPAPGYPPAYQQPSFGSWQAAPKPGIVPLRPLGVGEILDGAFAALRRYPSTILSVCAIVATISGVLEFSLAVALRDTPSDSLLYNAQIALSIVIPTLSAAVISGALSAIIGDAVLGRPVGPGRVWAQIQPRLGALVGASILVILAVSLGTLLLLVPGVYLLVALSFTTPALVLEGRTVGGAMSRSRELINGSWWRVFGVLLLGGFISLFISSFIQIPFLAVAGGSGLLMAETASEPSTLSLAIITLGDIVATTVTAGILAGVVVLLYMDRRMRREGLDVALAQAAATGRPSL